MGTVGGYTLDMYCDHPDCRAQHSVSSLDGQVQASDKAEAFHRARAAGWKINKGKEADVPDGQSLGTGTCICPKH